MNSRRQILKSIAPVMLALTQVAGAMAVVRKMPVLFVGHGSPTNAIADNQFTKELASWGTRLPVPTAILVVSAHWLTNGATGVTVNALQRTIHDFSGFPRELHEMQYPAHGHPELALKAAGLISSNRAVPTLAYGLDHGAWAPLSKMFPRAQLPVFQVSIDYGKPASFHYAVGRELQALREAGVLIVCSGNIVHNLRATDRGAGDSPAASRPWATSFDDSVRLALAQRDDSALLAYQELDSGALMAVPTPDHYWPLLYALGASDPAEAPETVFSGFQSGTLSMRCLQFG